MKQVCKYHNTAIIQIMCEHLGSQMYLRAGTIKVQKEGAVFHTIGNIYLHFTGSC